MADEGGRRRRSHPTVAVILLLCSLAPSLTCFSWRVLSKKAKQNKVVSEATVMEGRTGSIFFNGKELNSQSGSPFVAAMGNDELLHVDLDQSDGTGMSEQASQLEDAMANEAAWRRLNPSLHCGQNKMKLKAMGPGAADLQLDMGNARPLPLIQVPEPCGYSMRQNALGLVCVVPYDGCNVIQENGNYVLPMSWLETPVKFTCPMSPRPDATPTSTTAKPAQQPLRFPFPHGRLTPYRHKRDTEQPPYIYNPNSLYSAYLNYLYYMYMMTVAPTTDTGSSTTTAKPDTTTTITEPTTEKLPQMEPPAYPYYPYYLYHPFYPYYPYYSYYPLPNLPVSTTAPPATTGTATSGMTTTAKTITTASTYYPPYFTYPPAGKPLPEIPDSSEIYYYPVIQHFYGKPPYPTTAKPGDTATTAKPGDTATTAKPGDTATTAKPSTTTKPTTASAPTTASSATVPTTKACSSTTKPSSSSYPGPMSPYVPYYQLPFTPYISYKANKAGKIPDQKYIPQAGYKSGLQARAHPHPGFHYWQPGPWFPRSTGQDHPQFDWKNLLPKHELQTGLASSDK